MLSDVAASVRLVDLVEIGFVSVFFYILIAWLRNSITQRAFRNALAAVVIIALAYVTALSLEMYFIEMLIEHAFIVFVLAAIVIFQRDIRRMFERIGTWGLFGWSTREAPADSIVDTLTEAAAKMAEDRTGALFAVRGQEDWENVIDGGVRLNGKVSLPLLYSLFNPETPGHDGAAMIEGDSLVMFSAHLPLSANLPAGEEGGGTRHAAALGLAEMCDAFVIAVSEERGTISVAQGGEIKTMASAAELRRQLANFWKKHYEAPGADSGLRWQRSLVTGAFAIFLAVFCWAAIAYRPDTVYRSYVVPVELRNLPPDWMLEEPVPIDTRVTLSGPDRAFRSLNPSELVVSIDLAQVHSGVNELEITHALLKPRSNLRLYDASPRTVRLEAKRLQDVRVPVEVHATGSLPDTLELVGFRLDPDTVTVLVPEGIQAPRNVRTEPVALDSIDQSQTVPGRFVLPANLRLPQEHNRDVRISVEVRSRQQSTAHAISGRR